MGFRTEKLLVKTAEENDYAANRVDFTAGGGYHVPHDMGDVLIGRRLEGVNFDFAVSEIYLVEEKYKATDKNKYLQEKGKKADGFIEFAEKLGAVPLFAARWSSNLQWSPGPNHYVTDIREIERTDAGNLSVKPETAEQWETAEEFFSGK